MPQPIPPEMMATIEAAGKVCDCVTALLRYQGKPEQTEIMLLLEMLHADRLGAVTAANEKYGEHIGEGNDL